MSLTATLVIIRKIVASSFCDLKFCCPRSIGFRMWVEYSKRRQKTKERSIQIGSSDFPWVKELGGLTDPDYQRETGLLLHIGGKKDCIWSVGGPLTRLLELPCLMIDVNEKLYQSNPGRMAKDTDPSGVKAWVTPPKRNQCLLRC